MGDVARAFSMALSMLDLGRELGERQALEAARNFCSKIEFDRIGQFLELKKRGLQELTREDFERIRDAAPSRLAKELKKNLDDLEEHEALIGGHLTYHVMRGVFIAGLKSYAAQAGLTLEEVLASVPSTYRAHLLATIDELPDWAKVVPIEVARETAELLAGDSLFDTQDER